MNISERLHAYQITREDADYLQSRRGTSYHVNCVVMLPSGVKICGKEMNRYTTSYGMQNDRSR